MARRITRTDDTEFDRPALFTALARSLPYLILFAAIVGVGTFFVLSRIPPVYRSEATILIDSGEGDLAAGSRSDLDEQAINSQVQLIRSRDLARTVAAKLDLASRAEYDPARNNSTLTSLLVRFGLAHNPAESSPEERVLAGYYRNLDVHTIDRSRVIAIDFSSSDPEFAADAANAIAGAYIDLQRATKAAGNADAAKWLQGQIADLKAKAADAEARIDAYRAAHGLGPSAEQTAKLGQQQLADANAELARVKADAQATKARADQIRAAIANGTVASVTDALASPLIQRRAEQQASLRSQIAELSATLLPEHPRMRELRAQVADLELQIDQEAQKVLDGLDAQARDDTARQKALEATVADAEAAAVAPPVADDDTAELRALKADAAAAQQTLAGYQQRLEDLTARQGGGFLSTGSRIISTAAPAIAPDFPRTLPMAAIAAAVAFFLGLLLVLLRELAGGRPSRRIVYEPVPAEPQSVPVKGHLRWADDRGIRRMMPSEPTLAPPVRSEIEQSLAAIATQVETEGKRRILVTLAEGSDEAQRPLAAAALVRALARNDRRAVLIDLRGDTADNVTMGQGTDLPGFTDLYAETASFAQVIFRDRQSRAHFIPAGHAPVSPETLTGERMTTILSALDHTYDHVVIDAGDGMIASLAPTTDAVLVVTDFSASDPRTIRAAGRITSQSTAAVLLLVVDAPPQTAALAEAAA